MALTDLLQALGEDEDAQAAKLEAVLKAAAEAQELTAKTQSLAGSVERLELKRDELLAEKKRLSRAAKLLAEAGINFDDDNAETLLKVKLAAKGEKPSESDIEVIEMRSALNKLTAQLNQITDEAETSKKENAELKAKKIKDDIKQTVINFLGNTSAGVCLAASKLFNQDQNNFVITDDNKTVLWKDGDNLRTLEDYAAASYSNPEDSVFWAGRGSSGSGTIPGGGSATIEVGSSRSGSSNPFEVGGNGTQAAKMLKSDPRTAERLISEARTKGKLSPAIERMLAMRKS